VEGLTPASADDLPLLGELIAESARIGTRHHRSRQRHRHCGRARHRRPPASAPATHALATVLFVTGIGDTLREHQAALESSPRPLTPTRTVTAPARHPPGGSSRPPTGPNPSPASRPGSSRSTAPATATWPLPSPPAGARTTCASTAWTSCPTCGRCSTSSPNAPPRTLSAQAEYQARILPAPAAQLTTETTRCGHTLPRMRRTS
jgi:hypothetical protein